MRNIHILPTNKTSRLIHNDANQLIYQSNDSFKNDRKWMYRKAFSIYITSDEKPKQGEWCLCQNKILKSIEDIIGDEFKKIILTTDTDLIKDGVQAIDDEFLEWFVKNPSCELIKTDSYQTIYNTWLYKIIIPKEEESNYNSKQEIKWISENQNCKQIDSCYNSLSKKCICPKEEPKQETIEEVAERFANECNSYESDSIAYGVEFGAKWQQEQDNEVIQNLRDRLDTVRHINTAIIKAVEKLKEQYDIDVINAFNEGQALSVRGKLIQGKEWFKKFKKK